jgi:lysophospholipase L1-like esterase
MRKVWLPAMGLALLGGLALAEWLLRARHRRSALRAGEDGLRPETRRLDPAGLADQWRIVALGDSITHGFDLPAEQAYPALLQARLRSAMPGRRITVINSGVCGHTAVQGWLRVERDVVRFRPALTIIAFGLNDAALGRSAEDARREAAAFPTGWGAILAQSHLFQTLRGRARRLGWLRRLAEDHYWPNASRSTPAAFRRALAGLARRSGSGGGRVLLLTTHPAAFDAERPARLLAGYNAITRQVAAASGVGLLDVERACAGHDMATLLDGDGVHLTLAGQRALADIIAERVLAEWGRPPAL